MTVYVTKEFARKAGLLDAKLLQAAGDVPKGKLTLIWEAAYSSSGSPAKVVGSRAGPHDHPV